MTLNIKKETLLNYLNLTLALVFVYWVMTVYEVVLSKTSVSTDVSIVSILLYKFLNDFLTGLFLGLIALPLFLIIALWRRKLATVIVIILFSLGIIIQFALVKYSLTTLLFLGADILGYSFDDAVNTVGSSESISLVYFLPFIIFPALLLVFRYLLNAYANWRVVAGTTLVLFVGFGILGFSVPEATSESFQNKTAFFVSDILKFQRNASEISALNFEERTDYPLLKPFNSPDVLSPFLNSNEEKPNIVVIVVEGLGSEFVANNQYSGFTPYLDELISKSLYWENFVSTTGRSFGLLPSLFGSLPFGETGFLELKDTPSHLSLINILKANGYYTSFYSGDASSFDRKINFLEYNGIDNLIDESKYGSEFSKTKANDGGFSWGYPDGEIFKKTLQTQSLEKQPRLDVVMTLTNHEPFEYPDKERYMSEVDDLVKASQKTEALKSKLLSHRDIFGSLLYMDASLKAYMEAYSKRPDYKNTIFMITGDHRLIPIAMKDKLCRYHVPFLIYSPMLKKPMQFKSVSSHWDVAPSVLSYLESNYKLNPINKTAWLGKGLDTVKTFRNVNTIPLMRYKGDISDIIYKEYLLSGNELYSINERFQTSKVDDKGLTKTITDSLRAFKRLNAYVTQQNKIYPEALNVYSEAPVAFTSEQLAIINKYTEGRNFDELFVTARNLALEKEYKTAVVLCDYILNELPNYSEARILKGRMLAWQGDYSKAEVLLLGALNRTPFIDDVYLAILDLYWWSDQDQKSQSIFEQAVKNEVKNPEIAFKMAKAYQRINKIQNSAIILDSLIQTYPDSTRFKTLKNSLP